MNSKHLLTFSVFTFLSLSVSYAQRITYKIIEDNPTKHHVHLFYGGIIETDLHPSNNRYGSYVTAIIKLHKRLTIGGDFMWGSKKGMKTMNEIAYNDFQPFMDLSGRMSFFFSAKTFKENIKITLSSNTYQGYGYTVTSEKYIYAPAKKTSLIGFTGSAGFYQNNVLDNSKDTLFRYEDKATGTPIDIRNGVADFSGMRFTGGFQFSSMRNFEIDATDASHNYNYGSRKNKGRTDVYIEGLFMPLINVNKEMRAKVKNGSGEYTMTETPQLKYFGYRIRVDTYQTGIVGLGFRFEFGQKPGIVYTVGKNKYKNMYLTAGIMIGING
ncbi:MAG: hypothetical protein LC109_01695 [Bacteroidia bacterium]|nr:hypothetical protein [Bacteroidia bacterium]